MFCHKLDLEPPRVKEKKEKIRNFEEKLHLIFRLIISLESVEIQTILLNFNVDIFQKSFFLAYEISRKFLPAKNSWSNSSITIRILYK